MKINKWFRLFALLLVVISGCLLENNDSSSLRLQLDEELLDMDNVKIQSHDPANETEVIAVLWNQELNDTIIDVSHSGSQDEVLLFIFGYKGDSLAYYSRVYYSKSGGVVSTKLENPPAEGSEKKRWLQNLVVQGGALDKTFDPEVSQYSINLEYSQSILLFKPVLDSGFSGNIYLSDSSNQSSNNLDTLQNEAFSEQLFINSGDTAIYFKSAALPEDSQIVYKVRINRKLDPNANLLSFGVSRGYADELHPNFNKDTLQYVWIVNHDFPGDRKLILKTASPNSTIQVGDSVYHHGDELQNHSHFDSLQVGPNLFNIKVVAQDTDSVKTYTINLFRKSQDAVYDLPPFPGDCKTQVWTAKYFNGVPYILYSDCQQSNRLTVRYFLNGKWNLLGQAGFSTSNAGINTSGCIALKEMEMIQLQGTVYVAYRDDGYGGKATVKGFINGSWKTLGTEGFTVKSVYDLHLFKRDGKLWLTYREGLQQKILQYQSFEWVEQFAGEEIKGKIVISDEGIFNAHSNGGWKLSEKNEDQWDTLHTITDPGAYQIEIVGKKGNLHYAFVSNYERVVYGAVTSFGVTEKIIDTTTSVEPLGKTSACVAPPPFSINYGDETAVVMAKLSGSSEVKVISPNGGGWSVDGYYLTSQLDVHAGTKGVSKLLIFSPDGGLGLKGHWGFFTPPILE